MRRYVSLKAALLAGVLTAALPFAACADNILAAQDSDDVARAFHFEDGTTVPALRLHYATLGTPRRDASGSIANAVMLLHGTTGTGRQFLGANDLRDLFGPGKPLDATRYYIILPDGIGAGGSSKPSDGLQAHFPHYGYGDQVEAQRRLLGDLGIRHLALLLGTSMGGMQAWIWAERHPDMADGMVAIAATPAPVTGRNMMWRDMIMDAIKADPDFHGGQYRTEPKAWRAVLPVFAVMTGDARHLEHEAPTRDAAESVDARMIASGSTIDANDYLATFESSWDYDPSAGLDRIAVPFLAVNFGDDLLNPAELGVTDAAMAHVRSGRSILIPAGPGTFGHQTLNHPEIWGPAVAAFLATLPGH